MFLCPNDCDISYRLTLSIFKSKLVNECLETWELKFVLTPHSIATFLTFYHKQ